MYDMHLAGATIQQLKNLYTDEGKHDSFQN